MTFKEAYLRTGRILNISVIPADRHSPTKLLNYVTAPDTIIWTALLASAAVPGILNPVVLMQKLRDGTVVPWNWGSRFKDGSLRVDIPTQALNLYFNGMRAVQSCPVHAHTRCSYTSCGVTSEPTRSLIFLCLTGICWQASGSSKRERLERQLFVVCCRAMAKA